MAFSCSKISLNQNHFFLKGGDELRCPSRYYRDSRAFLIPSRVSSRDWGSGILAVPVLRAGRIALENTSRLRVSPRAAADGTGRGTVARREAPLDRRIRHWHQQDAG